MTVFENTLVIGMICTALMGGALLWFDGYKNSGHVPSNVNFRFLSRPIRLPMFLYIISGMPTSSKYPKGVVTAWAFSGQLMGIGWLICAAVAFYLSLDVIKLVILFFITMGVTQGITYWMTKNKAFRE